MNQHMYMKNKDLHLQFMYRTKSETSTRSTLWKVDLCNHFGASCTTGVDLSGANPAITSYLIVFSYTTS